MEKIFIKILKGYEKFREKYAIGDQSIMQYLSSNGQKPQIMVISCCDSRVDPAVILQCDPGDLFVVRNVANIVPPYEIDDHHHGTSAALEFGVRFLKIKHLILFGHSQCGGIQSLIDQKDDKKNDFISQWVSLVKTKTGLLQDVDEYAKWALHQSYKNCLTFPWIHEEMIKKQLVIHLWFFDIKTGQIFTCPEKKEQYFPLGVTPS